MAQSGYTPILIYASGTASNVPLAANMISGSTGAELALNYADGKLYYKDSGGTVQLLASKAANNPVTTFSGGTTGLTPNTATSGAVTLAGTLASSNGGTGLTTFTAANYALYSTSSSALTAGTLPVAAGGTGLTSLTANYIPYGNGTSAFSNSSTFTFNGTTLSAPAYAATATITGSATSGAYAYGTLSYSDVNIFASSSLSNNNYTQVILQNTNAGTAASADFIVSNNNGTATTYYGDFGITSSGYNTPGQNITNNPNTVYLQAVSSDLAIGTLTSAKNVYVYAGGATSAALTINGTTGIASIPSTTYAPNINLTDAATIAWDTSKGQVATFTFVSSNRTMGAPTNLSNGAFYALAVIQNGGSNTLSWNSVFKWANGTAPTLSTAAGAKDYFVFRSDGTNLYQQGISQAVS